MTIRLKHLVASSIVAGLVATAASIPATAGGYGMKSSDGSYGMKSSTAAYGTKKTTSDVVDIAISAGSFNTLVTAVKAAGLVETLKGDGPFTVFAPTDEAFAKIPTAKLNALLADKEALTAVLTYHVVPGKVTSSDLAGKRLTSAKTVQGQPVSIDARSGVKVNGANVVKADIMASNGVIHVIDTVILPPEMTSATDSAPRVASY